MENAKAFSIPLFICFDFQSNTKEDKYTVPIVQQQDIKTCLQESGANTLFKQFYSKAFISLNKTIVRQSTLREKQIA